MYIYYNIAQIFINTAQLDTKPSSFLGPSNKEEIHYQSRVKAKAKVLMEISGCHRN